MIRPTARFGISRLRPATVARRRGKHVTGLACAAGRRDALSGVEPSALHVASAPVRPTRNGRRRALARVLRVLIEMVLARGGWVAGPESSAEPPGVRQGRCG